MACSTISKLAVLACVFLSGCSSLLYYPTRIEHVDRTNLPVKPIDENFASEDGVKLHAWRFVAPEGGPKKCVILQFHGNGQNLSTHFYSLYWILEYGYDYMVFDYHGYGSSEGKPSPKATVEDGHAALRRIHALYPDKKIVVVAQSLGGAVGMRSVIDLHSEIPVSLVLADSTFLSYRSAARAALSHSWITWLFQPIGWLVMNDEYAPGNRVSEIAPTPLIVMHGTEDTAVSYSLGEKVYASAHDPRELWPIQGGRHIDGLFRPGIREKFLAKLGEICQ